MTPGRSPSRASWAPAGCGAAGCAAATRVAVVTAVGVLLLMAGGGCAQQRASVIEAFPPASLASPWALQGEVWAGTFEEAGAALGDEAEEWREFSPTHVWLAIYRHENEPERCLTVRCFACAASTDARRAFDFFKPAGAAPLEAGDAGCWTEIGVLFRWGRLVIEVFGHSATWSSQVQSSYLAAFITKRMPPGAPEQPE